VDDAASARFAVFAASRGPRLRRLAFMLVGDWVEAQDLTQTALTRVFLAWGRVESADDPDAYARRVLINAARSGRRRRRVTHVLTSRPPDRPVADPNELGPDRERVRRALLGLPPRQRAVIALRFFEDLTEPATAAVLGVSVGTVKSQTAKALATLRRDPALSEEVPR
jgi:RNA polymerase sigma-70 factor (sigma-E family)